MPSQPLAHPPGYSLGEQTEKQRRPWRCANTGQQQLKCWRVINAVLLTNLKPSSMRAARKKSNSILSGPRAKRALLSAPTRSARREQPRAPCVGISLRGLPVPWPSGCHSSPAQAKQEPGCACTPSRHTHVLPAGTCRHSHTRVCTTSVHMCTDSHTVWAPAPGSSIQPPFASSIQLRVGMTARDGEK